MKWKKGGKGEWKKWKKIGSEANRKSSTKINLHANDPISSLKVLSCLSHHSFQTLIVFHTQSSFELNSHMQVDGRKCTHMPTLPKKSVSELLLHPPEPYCEVHNELKDARLLEICLHCSKMYCSRYTQNNCVQKHQEETRHCFTIELTCGTVFCLECKASVQDLIFDYSGPHNDQEYCRMARFQSFIKGTVSQLKPLYSIENHQTQDLEVAGLTNLGNTCFLNSTLQSLYATAPLKKMFNQIKIRNQGFRIEVTPQQKLLSKETEWFYDDILEKSEQNCWHTVTSRKTRNQHQYRLQKRTFPKDIDQFYILFKQTFDSMSNSKNDLWEPQSLLHFLGEVSPKYNSNQEQDAEELLLLILDYLSQAEWITIFKNNSTYSHLDERYTKVEKLLGRQKITPTQQISCFYLVNEIICSQCKHTVRCFDLAYNLCFGLGRYTETGDQPVEGYVKYYQREYSRGDKASFLADKGLPDYLKKFFAPEKLTQLKNYFQCEKCSSLSAMHEMFLLDLPQILMISLKRFSNSSTKNSEYVPIPLKLDFSAVTLQDRETKSQKSIYKLYGVIVHQGKSVHSGHYFCYVIHNGHWVRCSDEHIRLSSWKQVQSQEAYILFYQRNIQE